jgi:AcrR family transcriptional regulator
MVDWFGVKTGIAALAKLSDCYISDPVVDFGVFCECVNKNISSEALYLLRSFYMLLQMSQISNITTRQSILNAAITEFWEHGYRGASVRDICTRAGASSNAITYHFGSKEKVYQEILDQFATLQLEQTYSALSGELRSQEEFEIRLEMFLTQLLETYFDNRETLLIALREFEKLPTDNANGTISKLMEVNRSLTKFLQTAKDRGFVREDVDTGIFAGTLLDRLINQARYAHTHVELFNVTSHDPKYRAYWVRASLGLVLEGAKPRTQPA